QGQGDPPGRWRQSRTSPSKHLSPAGPDRRPGECVTRCLPHTRTPPCPRKQPASPQTPARRSTPRCGTVACPYDATPTAATPTPPPGTPQPTPTAASSTGDSTPPIRAVPQPPQPSHLTGIYPSLMLTP